MREILFRGKSVDGDVWLHGSLTITDIDRAGRETKEYRITKVCYCFDESGFPYLQIGNDGEVLASTIGQFTGLYDANNNPIFEGDILQFGDKKLLVWWNEEAFQWQARSILSYDVISNREDKPLAEWNNIDLGWIYAEIPCTGHMTTEIIGNIFDNPWLIDGDDDNGSRKGDNLEF